METFSALLAPFKSLGPPLGGPRGENIVPKANFMHIVKTSIFTCVLLIFGGLGSPVELQMVASAPLWDPCGGLLVIFGCKKCCIEFWSHKVTKRSGRGRKVCGRGEAQRRGGRLRLRAMQGFVPSIQHALLPLTRCGGFTGYRLCRRPLQNLMHGSEEEGMTRCLAGSLGLPGCWLWPL